MLKKALIIGVLGVSMFAMRGGEALAHYHGYLRINGFLRHVSSFDCGINIRGVRNLDQHQAVFKCEATITEVRVLCVNPRNNKKFKGKDVRPGSVATRIVISGETAILDEDITNKKKGLATVAVPITDDIILQNKFCVNPNWEAIEALSTKVTARVRTFACIGPDGEDDPETPEVEGPSSVLEEAYFEVLDCLLPTSVDFGDPPVPGGVPYECIVTERDHVS